jgi:hypothetical protein
MATPPFAISVHSFVNSVGADAGFASIIGLAILVLLYFAQARETATLRDRLDEAAQRAAGLEARLAQLAQIARSQAPSGPPVAPAPAGAQGARPAGSAVASIRRPGAATAAAAAGAGPASAVAGRAGAGLPGPLVGAPAGMAAPALSSATRLIPAPDAAPALVATAAPAVAAAAPAGVPSPVPVPAGGVPESAGPSEDTILARRPATVAAGAGAGANGHGHLPPVAPPPTVSSPVPPRVEIRSAASGAGAGAGAPGARRAAIPLRPGLSRQPGLARRLVPVLIGLGAVVVVVVALLLITGGSSSKTVVHKPSSKLAGGRAHRTKTAAFDPATVTVAVLNGTAITNLAHDVFQLLVPPGYKAGAILTAADQTHSSTIVGYTPGHVADARQVAKALRLSASSVQPADQQALGVACPQSPSACSADVIVTVGSDLQSIANSASPQTTTT